MIEYKSIAAPKVNINVEYQLYLLALSKWPKNGQIFFSELIHMVAPMGEGTHEVEIDDIKVKVKLILVTLEVPTNDKGNIDVKTYPKI